MPFTLSSLTLNSPDFVGAGRMPDRRWRCNGDVSPALVWGALPEGTQSLALFCHDPDASMVDSVGRYGFVHWLVYNIPATRFSLERGCRAFSVGRNDFGQLGYGGPAGAGKRGSHPYYFWLLALDTALELKEGLQLPEFMTLVEPHVLGMNRLIGLYDGQQWMPEAAVDAQPEHAASDVRSANHKRRYNPDVIAA